jgi:hypothetical protein
VTAAMLMKLKVASKDRGERLAMPHTPCPLVQSEPKRVPNPTSNPDTASSKSYGAQSKGGGGNHWPRQKGNPPTFSAEHTPETVYSYKIYLPIRWVGEVLCWMVFR